MHVSSSQKLYQCPIETIKAREVNLSCRCAACTFQVLWSTDVNPVYSRDKQRRQPSLQPWQVFNMRVQGYDRDKSTTSRKTTFHRAFKEFWYQCAPIAKSRELINRHFCKHAKWWLARKFDESKIFSQEFSYWLLWSVPDELIQSQKTKHKGDSKLLEYSRL